MATLAICPRWLRFPRPQTFLGFMSLQTGTELISLILLFNKLTGFYGLLAVLTGFSLSATQLSAYLYNLTVLVVLAFCIPHIRRESPLQNIVLAWVYAIDTVANATYTTVFAAGWYLLASSADAAAVSATAVSTAASTAVATAAAIGTTAPAVAFRDEAGPAAAAAITSVAAALATTAAEAASPVETSSAESTTTSTLGGGGWMGAHETAASLTLIVAFTVVRFYFGIIVAAYARQVLQRYAEAVPEQGLAGAEDSSTDGEDSDQTATKSSSRDLQDDHDIDDEEAGLKSGTRSARGRRHRRLNIATSTTSKTGRNPFAEGSPAGEGWKGRVGRALVSVGTRYWLRREPNESWTRNFGAKFRKPVSAR